jgi:hypothetical protein
VWGPRHALRLSYVQSNVCRVHVPHSAHSALPAQVVNLHYMLSKAVVKARPNVLWCYKNELHFSRCSCDPNPFRPSPHTAVGMGRLGGGVCRGIRLGQGHRP